LRRLWEEWQYHHKYGVGYQPIEQTSGNDVRQMQRYLRTLGYLRANDRAVFDERGEPRGVFNDATANAVVQWKKAAGFDEGAYLVPHMLRELKKQAEQKGGIR